MGRSIHAGQVCVADGTDLAAQKIERVLTNDPGMGVIRHVDAGYDRAVEVAAERGVRIPMSEAGPLTGRTQGGHMTVIVVGAGLAGLSAASVLVEAGQEVVVLEARHRVGGRVEGGTIAGHPVELGGTWLGEGHSRMHSLVQELGLETFRTFNDEGQLLVEFAGRQSRMKSHKGAVPRLDPFALADLAQGLYRFERMARKIDIEAPWNSARADAIDGQTFESWIRRNLRTSGGRSYFRVACEAVFCARRRRPLTPARAVLRAGQHRPRDPARGRPRRSAGPRRRGFCPGGGSARRRLGDRVRLGLPVRGCAPGRTTESAWSSGTDHGCPAIGSWWRSRRTWWGGWSTTRSSPPGATS